MPPSIFFFNKKRRAIVKRETHQKDGATVKRHRVMYDGHALDETEFAMEMAGSLGAFAMANQCSVGNLAEQLKHRNLLVRILRRSEPVTDMKFNNSKLALMRIHRLIEN
jgi:hypothetical protein